MKEEQTNLESFEIGGNAAQILKPETVGKVLEYTVKNYTIEETEYGKRVDFIVCDDFAEWKVGHWNLISKERFKPLALIGKKVRLTTVKQGEKLKFQIALID